jgi:hypothetical protein
MDTQQAIVEVTERPKVGDLIMEFKRNGSQGDQFGRMLRAEDTRLARWDGQSEDGKKHAKDQPDGDEVFPWEGASDVRDYLADGAVNESVALCYMAFWNAVLKISGATPNDTAASASATEFLDWVIHFQLLKQLDNEVELSAQYMHAIGATALHVTWEREVGRRLQPVTMEQLQGMAEQVDQQVAALIQQQRQVQMSGRGGQPVTQTAAGAATDAPGAGALPPELLQLQEVLGALPQMIEDPEMEGQAIKAVQYLFDEYVRRNLPEDIQEEEVLELSVKRARQAVKELRTEGKCEWPMPFLARNQPKIMALKPYRDFVLPVEVGAMETAPVVFVRDLMTEADLRRMVLGAGWDADWVEEAVKTKGRFSTWQLNNPYSAYGTWSWRAVDNRSWLIEVVYAYYKQIDDDGVTQITMTVFSPHLTTNPKGHDARAVEVKDGDGHVILDDFAGWFGILNYPRADYPVILGRRERFDRSWLATRGLAEILNTDQNVEKAMIDNVVDLAGISTVPPLNVPKGLTAKYKIGPAVQNEFVPGREPHFMQMPTAGMAPAETVVSGIRTRMNRYCGLFDAALPPQLAALLQQPMVKKFLIMWGEALQLAYELTVKFAPEKILAVTGQAPSGSLDDFHYVMQFDATQFHPELMEAKLAAFSDLAANDRTGTIDQAALTKFKAMMIDPGMAKQLVLDQGQASVALEKGVQSDLANMFLGSEAIYDDASNDPAANMKLGYAAKHLQGNPNFMAALDPRVAQEALGPQVAQQMAMAQAQNGSKPNGRFSELVANYLKNLKQGADQQANKGVGRTGVKQLT